VKVAVAQAGGKGFVVGAHSWMGSVGRNKAQPRSRKDWGRFRKPRISSGGFQRTQRRPGSLRGVICSARAVQRVPAWKDLLGGSGLGLFPQFQFF
jgi:hypothetical protein